MQIYRQKTDLKVLNIFSIKTYQIFPAGMHIIRSETFGETFLREKSVGETFRAKKSRRESRIGLYAWLPTRLSPSLVFFTQEDRTYSSKAGHVLPKQDV